MTRFDAFAGSVYYPNGGWYDYRGSADTREEAIDILKRWLSGETTWQGEKRDRYLWAHLYDMVENKIEDVKLADL